MVALGVRKDCLDRAARGLTVALRTLRRMLKKAQEWQLLSTVPIVKLVEEQGREELIEPWMEQRLLTVTAGPRLTGKDRSREWAGSRFERCC